MPYVPVLFYSEALHESRLILVLKKSQRMVLLLFVHERTEKDSTLFINVAIMNLRATLEEVQHGLLTFHHPLLYCRLPE